MMSQTISVSQTRLVSSILTTLDKENPGFCTSARQYNSIIKAADAICEAMASVDIRSEPGEGLTAWLKSDDTGSSSKYMASVLTDGKRLHFSHAHPWDPGDFGRCRKLLLAVPEFQSRLARMADRSPVWANLVSHWGQLCGEMDGESPDWASGAGSAPKTHQLMKELGC